MLVQRTFDLDHPMLWSIAQAEKQNNPILIDNDWLFFKSFDKRERDVIITFEKVDVKPTNPTEAEKNLIAALAEIK